MANSLGKLAAAVQRINTEAQDVKVALFAGRRSSDRVFLLLQNHFVRSQIRNFVGSSSILAVSHADSALGLAGVEPVEERVFRIGMFELPRCSCLASWLILDNETLGGRLEVFWGFLDLRACIHLSAQIF